jgi:hypothetical protein
VQQHVGVAVSDGAAVVRDLDAAEPQWPARFQPVRVVSDADAEVGRGCILRGLGKRAKRQPDIELRAGLYRTILEPTTRLSLVLPAAAGEALRCSPSAAR